MNPPDPVPQLAFVHADGKLAELLCRVRLLELTPDRARELCAIHRSHPPDECAVHLEAVFLLAAEDG